MIVYLQMIETDEDKSKFEEIYQEYRNLRSSINLIFYTAQKQGEVLKPTWFDEKKPGCFVG